MPYSAFEEHNIADLANPILSRLNYENSDDIDKAIEALGNLLNPSLQPEDASSRYQPVLKELNELITNGFEIYIHGEGENSVLRRTYQYRANFGYLAPAEPRHVYTAPDPTKSEAEQIAAAKQEYQQIINRMIGEKYLALKSLTPEQRQQLLDTTRTQRATGAINRQALEQRRAEGGPRPGSEVITPAQERAEQEMLLALLAFNRRVNLPAQLNHHAAAQSSNHTQPFRLLLRTVASIIVMFLSQIILTILNRARHSQNGMFFNPRHNHLPNGNVEPRRISVEPSSR